MSDFLPGEILIEILARLPVKSLLQFRCVSKSWYSLISSPDFITANLNVNVNNYNNHFLLFKHKKFIISEDKHHVYHTLNHEDTFAEYARFDYPFTREYFGLKIASCNGLLCVSDYDNVTIVLWNPMIKKYLTLPTPNFTYMTHGPNMSVAGLGFDYRANDYKVVRIVHLEGRYGSNVCPPEVELYELEKGSWRGIKSSAPAYVFCEDSQACVNGAVHWIALDKSSVYDHRSLIVAFDMIDEVFREISLPDSVSRLFVLNLAIKKFGESLALYHCDKSPPNNHYSIWIMKEYGVAKSWVNQYKLGLGQGLTTVHGLMKNGELLLGATRRVLVLWNPKNQQMKNVDFPCPSNCSFFMDTYIESLVLLGHRQTNSYDAVTFKEEKDEIGEHQQPTMIKGARRIKKTGQQAKWITKKGDQGEGSSTS